MTDAWKSKQDDSKTVKHEAGAKQDAPAAKEPLFPPPPGWDPPPPVVVPGQETDPAGMVGLMEGETKSKHSEDPKHSGKGKEHGETQ